MGVGMLRMGKEFVRRSLFHYTALFHHHDSVGEEFDHRKVMGDENIGVPMAFFQFVKQIQHLRLDGDIEG